MEDNTQQPQHESLSPQSRMEQIRGQYLEEMFPTGGTEVYKNDPGFAEAVNQVSAARNDFAQTYFGGDLEAASQQRQAVAGLAHEMLERAPKEGEPGYDESSDGRVEVYGKALRQSAKSGKILDEHVMPLWEQFALSVAAELAWSDVMQARKNNKTQ